MRIWLSRLLLLRAQSSSTVWVPSGSGSLTVFVCLASNHCAGRKIEKGKKTAGRQEQRESWLCCARVCGPCFFAPGKSDLDIAIVLLGPIRHGHDSLGGQQPVLVLPLLPHCCKLPRSGEGVREWPQPRKKSGVIVVFVPLYARVSVFICSNGNWGPAVSTLIQSMAHPFPLPSRSRLRSQGCNVGAVCKVARVKN